VWKELVVRLHLEWDEFTICGLIVHAVPGAYFAMLTRASHTNLPRIRIAVCFSTTHENNSSHCIIINQISGKSRNHHHIIIIHPFGGDTANIYELSVLLLDSFGIYPSRYESQ
jgi:hypothetical protein